MSGAILLDTGYLLALEMVGDQNHARAVDHWRSLAAPSPQVVTTSFVLCEAVTFLQSRRLHGKAVAVGTWLMRAEHTRLVHVGEGLLLEAWDYLTRRRDKTYSLTDCVSFVLIDRLGIRSALTFDRHFVQAGFEALP